MNNLNCVNMKSVGEEISIENSTFQSSLELNKDCELKNISFENTTFSGQSAKDKNNYNVLRKIASEYGKTKDAIYFENLERNIRYRSLKWYDLKKVINWFYKYFDYGSSISLPPVWLLIITIYFMSFLIFFNAPFKCPHPIGYIYAEGFKMFFLPFKYLFSGGLNSYECDSAPTLGWIVTEFLFKVFSVILWFLGFLGIRRHFKFYD